MVRTSPYVLLHSGGPESDKKILKRGNWSEFHFFKVTSYTIHILVDARISASDKDLPVPKSKHLLRLGHLMFKKDILIPTWCKEFENKCKSKLMGLTAS